VGVIRLVEKRGWWSHKESPDWQVFSPATPRRFPIITTTIMPINYFTAPVAAAGAQSRRERRARQRALREERDQFGHTFNRRNFPVSRDQRNMPYPQAQDVFIRTEGNPDEEDFGDVLLNDFVFATKRVSRRKLGQLSMSTYQRALLERGSLHQMEDIEEYNAAIEVSMGYTAAVGTSLAEDIAMTNGEVRFNE
jgi:hypothetical protein